MIKKYLFIIFIGFVFAIFCFFTNPTVAQSLPEDPDSLIQLRKAAEQGQAAAQSDLGAMYATGRGVPQDNKEAVDWFRKAADQGNPLAQYNLGLLYQEGKGVPQDYVEAVGWFRKAADQGLPLAQNNLGYLYEDGKGVPQDYKEAAKWFRKAADQGFPLAQFNLGYLYAAGKGVPQDSKQAEAWLKKAADQGNANAQNMLTLLYVSRTDKTAIIKGLYNRCVNDTVNNPEIASNLAVLSVEIDSYCKCVGMYSAAAIPQKDVQYLNINGQYPSDFHLRFNKVYIGISESCAFITSKRDD